MSGVQSFAPTVGHTQERPIRIGARRSRLAVAQAELVASLLAERGLACEVVGVLTQGDVDRRHLTEIGGTGVFAVAVREGVRDGAFDVAVHSMKDLPTEQPEGLEIAAVPAREDVREVLVGKTLEQLADGMRIGTGSPRRMAQLHAYAQERGIALEFEPIRGNVETRIGLVANDEVDATVLAAAGLSRLGLFSGGGRLGDLMAERLESEVILPAAAQGALAIEIAASAPGWLRAAVKTLDDPLTRAEVVAERSFLATMEAGCLAPVGVLATHGGRHGIHSDLTLEAVIGRTLLSTLPEAGELGPLLRVKDVAEAGQAALLGPRMARDALARMKDYS